MLQSQSLSTEANVGSSIRLHFAKLHASSINTTQFYVQALIDSQWAFTSSHHPTQSKSACYLSKASSFISPNLSFKPTPASSAEASKDSNGTSLPKLQSNYTTLPIPPLKPAAYHHHLKRYRHSICPHQQVPLGLAMGIWCEMQKC